MGDTMKIYFLLIIDMMRRSFPLNQKNIISEDFFEDYFAQFMVSAMG